MTEPSMVCNGHHKENNIDKRTVRELFSFDKLKCDTKKSEHPRDTMTIGTIPFPDFDHLYASSVENSETKSTTMSTARSYLNSCHLNIIEEQAKIIDSQNQEIIKLRKQNESLIARIERMNRRLNINQCTRRIRPKYSSRDANQSVCSEKNDQSSANTVHKNDSTSDDSGDDHKVNTNDNRTANFRFRFRRKEMGLNEVPRRPNKMVRFVEAKRSTPVQHVDKIKRNSAQTVDEKLKLEDAILFLKTTIDKPTPQVVRENHLDESDSDDASVTKRKRMRFPLVTTHEPFHMAVREDLNHLYDPITYTPTALEVPSFRVIERDNIDPSDVPKDYYEDVTIEAAKERHMRFEIGERKRKKWDVQRIRELRQNERLKEKLRRRKSRWNKLESPKTTDSNGHEQLITLFPDIKSIEKIMITNAVPITALGVGVAKTPNWGVEFHTRWINDGTRETSHYEESESQPQQHLQHHHRESRSRTVV